MNYVNWKETKDKGLLKFIFIEGSLFWGIPAGMLTGIIVNFSALLSKEFALFFKGLLFYTAIFFVFGWLFGLIMWFSLKEKEKEKE